MSITPLYTAADLDTEIAECKAAIRTARKILSQSVDTGNSSRQTTRQNLKDLTADLTRLQNERVKLEVGHGCQRIGRTPSA